MQSCRFLIGMVILCVCYELSAGYPTLPEHRALPSYASQNSIQSPRLSVVEWDQYSNREEQGPGTYAFGYDVQNPDSDDVHFRHEERLSNGSVVGSYGYVTPDGNAHVVKYIADHLGYRASIESTKRFADVKPIRVDVEQALADELALAEQALQNDEYQQKVATYDNKSKKYTTQTIQRRRFNTNGVNVNNRKENIYAVQNNIAGAVPTNFGYVQPRMF